MASVLNLATSAVVIAATCDELKTAAEVVLRAAAWAVVKTANWLVVNAFDCADVKAAIALVDNLATPAVVMLVS